MNQKKVQGTYKDGVWDKISLISLIQQMFIRYILSSEHQPRLLELSSEKKSNPSPLLLMTHFTRWRQTTNKPRSTCICQVVEQ